MKFGANLEEKIKTNVGIVFISLALIGFVVYSAIPAALQYAASQGWIPSGWGSIGDDLVGIGAGVATTAFGVWLAGVAIDPLVGLGIGIFVGVTIIGGM